MKTSLFTLALSAGLFAAAAPLPAAEPSARIVEYGLYSAQVTGFRPVEGTSGNVVVQSTNVVHVETTTRIPARVGAVFGFRYELSDLPVGRDIPTKSVMKHPPLRQPDGTVMTESVSTGTIKAGLVAAGNTYLKNTRWYFVKGFEYEMVPGTWTRQVYVDGKMVAEMAFEVYKP